MSSSSSYAPPEYALALITEGFRNTAAAAACLGEGKLLTLPIRGSEGDVSESLSLLPSPPIMKEGTTEGVTRDTGPV